MPIHLTCDFCATTSDVIGHWRFEGKTDIDVVICPNAARQSPPSAVCFQHD